MTAGSLKQREAGKLMDNNSKKIRLVSTASSILILTELHKYTAILVYNIRTLRQWRRPRHWNQPSGLVYTDVNFRPVVP